MLVCFGGEGGLPAAGGEDCTSFCNKTATSVTSEGAYNNKTNGDKWQKVLPDIYPQGDFPPQCKFDCFGDEKRQGNAGGKGSH